MRNYCGSTVTARRFAAQLASSDPSAAGRSLPQLITLIRAKHVSFSDFSVIWPIGHLAPSGRILLRIVGDLALAFFGDALGAALERLPKREMEEERRSSVKSTPPGRRKRRLRGKVGEVIVH